MKSYQPDQNFYYKKILGYLMKFGEEFHPENLSEANWINLDILFDPYDACYKKTYDLLSITQTAYDFVCACTI